MSDTRCDDALQQLGKAMRDKYTMAKPVLVSDAPDAHTVWLKVEGQSFMLDGYQDTKEEAEWTRLMLGKALANIKHP